MNDTFRMSVAIKANRILACISKNVAIRLGEVVIPLCPAPEQPQQECHDMF